MPVPTLGADEVARELLPDLRRLLAVLDDVGDEVAEIVLATCPLGSRSALVAYRIIDPVSPHDKATDEPVEVKLTGFGREVILASVRNLTDEDQAELSKAEQALDEARQRRLREQARDEPWALPSD